MRFSSIAATSTASPRGRFAAREGDEQRIVEQGGDIDVAAREGQSEEHAIELAAVQSFARPLARFLAQIEFEARPSLAQPGEHRRQQERRDRRNDAHPEFAVKRLTLGAGEVGKLVGRSNDPIGLVGDAFAKRGEAHDAPGALDQRDAEQGLEFAQARGQGRLRDEAGFGGASEMAVLAKRDEILQLLERRQVKDHRKIQSIAAL